MNASWMERNLSVQGYCLSAEESRRLRWGLRFPTALCLVLVVIGLALQSAALILGGVLVAVCGLVTTTNFCVPSTLLGFWSRHGTPTPTTQLS